MSSLISIIKKLRNTKDSIITFGKILLYRLKKTDKTCILFSNGMGYGGAPLVLLEMAKIYKSLGYKVIVYTHYYGKLMKIYKNNGIDVWISPLKGLVINKKIAKCEFDFIVVNTVVMSQWIKVFDLKNIPIIWWIHESYSFIKKYNGYMPDKLNCSTYVAGVSGRVIEGLEDNNLRYATAILSYGLEDLKSDTDNITNDRPEYECTYLVMGAICKNKNQIEALKAYNSMPPEYKNKSKIIFVGAPLDDKDSYYYDFLEEIKGVNNIEYIYAVSRKEISQLYNKIDVLICCSLEDSLPVVVTEALMFNKIVITSSGTGQYSLIKDGINGYKFNKNDAKQLRDKMISAYENKDNEIIKNNARLLYEQTFTIDVFQENVINYTNDILEKERKRERV